MGSMADREGFEPSMELPPCQFSRLVPSTTRSPVRTGLIGKDKPDFYGPEPLHTGCETHFAPCCSDHYCRSTALYQIGSALCKRIIDGVCASDPAAYSDLLNDVGEGAIMTIL